MKLRADSCRPKTMTRLVLPGRDQQALENLLNRDFSATAPSQKWPADISEFQLLAGKVYLS